MLVSLQDGTCLKYPRKTWKVATTTEICHSDELDEFVLPVNHFFNTSKQREKSLIESRKLHKAYREDFKADFRLRELRRTVDLINLKKCRILDVGCGNGIIQQFLPQDLEYVGIDFNDDYLTISWMGKGKNNKIVGEATHLPLRDNVFDIVLNLHMIEHLAEFLQENLISELSRVLKKGGQLIISTPNLGTWFNANQFVPPHNPKHYHCLTYSKLSSLLLQGNFRNIERFGFDIIIEYPNRIFKLIPYVFRRLLASGILGLEKHLLVRALKMSEEWTR